MRSVPSLTGWCSTRPSVEAGIPGVEDLSLTTNGYLLAGFAPALKAAGLHRVTVSLDTLDDDLFKKMSGRKYGPAPVLAGIAGALGVGLLVFRTAIFDPGHPAFHFVTVGILGSAVLAVVSAAAVIMPDVESTLVRSADTTPDDTR